MIAYRELASLEADLGFPARTLYGVSHNIEKHYRTVTIPKRGGGVRELSVPDGILKAIQRKINEKLLYYMHVSRYAHAYLYGRGIRTNATPHVNKRVVVKLDIYKFFDSVSYVYVRDYAFPPEIYSESNSILLAILCCNGQSLPQGAPTSPLISNIILKDFDDAVGAFCQKRSIAYTRYCDDMTFSGDFDPSEIIMFVKRELKKLHLVLNREKISVAYGCRKQSVTGITVNKKLSIDRGYKRRIRQEVYYINRYGIASHLRAEGIETDARKYLRQLYGRINYVLSVEKYNAEFIAYRESIGRLLK